MKKKLISKLKQIKLLLMDSDGVLTDGGIYLSGSGEEMNRFDVKDGHGLVMLKRAGIRLGVMSGRGSEALKRRAEYLGFDFVILDALDKQKAFNNFTHDAGISNERIAFIGDDIVDLPVLRRVGFSIAVQDSSPELISEVDYVTHAYGGNGAIREVAEIILKAQGVWEDITKKYFG